MKWKIEKVKSVIRTVRKNIDEWLTRKRVEIHVRTENIALYSADGVFERVMEGW